MVAHLPKTERQKQLQSLVSDDPLLTDEMLAVRLQVSVQTIRLDRLELGLPEMRERAREIVEMMQGRVRALALTEVVGELVDVKLGESGLSILETTADMGFKRTEIVRGHYLFAQANSLAIATTDADVAVTGSARLQFHHPVKVGDRVVAKAKVRHTKGSKSLVNIESHVGKKVAFSGSLIIFSMDDESYDLKSSLRVGNGE